MMNLGATQGCKFKLLLAPISINGTAATSLSLDCQGFKYATILFMSGLIGAANFDAALSLTESDDDSSYAAISGSGNGTPGDSSDALIWAWHLDCRKRKRYMQLVADPGAVACLVACVGILSMAEEMPNSVTEAGVTAALFL